MKWKKLKKYYEKPCYKIRRKSKTKCYSPIKMIGRLWWNGNYWLATYFQRGTFFSSEKDNASFEINRFYNSWQKAKSFVEFLIKNPPKFVEIGGDFNEMMR